MRDDLGVHQVALALLADLVQSLRGRKTLEMKKLLQWQQVIEFEGTKVFFRVINTSETS